MFLQHHNYFHYLLMVCDLNGCREMSLEGHEDNNADHIVTSNRRVASNQVDNNCCRELLSKVQQLASTFRYIMESLEVRNYSSAQ